MKEPRLVTESGLVAFSGLSTEDLRICAEGGIESNPGTSEEPFPMNDLDFARRWARVLLAERGAMG